MSDTGSAPEKKKRKRRGTVEIDAERCKGCAFCVEFCPTSCLGMSTAYNSKGYHPPELSAPDDCTGCGLCTLFCPDFAIFGHRIDK